MFSRLVPKLKIQWLLLFLLTAAFESDTEKKVLNLEDYPLWKQIVSVELSDDGKWMTYGLRPNDGDPTLFTKQLLGESEHEIPNGVNPKFSKDSKWVVYLLQTPRKQAEKLREERKPVPSTVEVMNLSTMNKVKVENASNPIFSNDSRFLAVRRDPGERGDGAELGTDLIVIDLASGHQQNWGNVTEFAFNHRGNLLARIVSARDGYGNGVYLHHLDTGVVTALDTSDSHYFQLTWAKEEDWLAALRGKQEKGFEEKENVLVVFPDLASLRVFDPGEADGFPPGYVVSEKGELRWSKDGTRVFFGIKRQKADPQAEPEEGESKEPEKVPNVDVWHWEDERIQSVQMIQAERDRRATQLSLWDLDADRFVRLADEDMPTVEVSDGGQVAVGRLDKPYRLDPTWGGSPADIYVIDLATGSRKLIERRVSRSLGLSPTGTWYLYQREGHIWAVDTASVEKKNISSSSPASFVNVDDDHPYEKPIWGIAGWMDGESAVLVNHRYDLWKLPLDNSKPENFTKGMGDREEIRLRHVNLDPDLPRGGGRFGRGNRRPVRIDSSAPLILSAYGEWTKKSGYYRLDAGEAPVPLLYEDKSVSGLMKARNADVTLFRRQTFEEFPDYSTSKLSFNSPVKVTDANPQQAEYAWGKRVLVDYENSRGIRLQATLALPADYEAGKRYPMIVYFYEKMSQRHHEYSMPRYDDRPHMSTYASNGYLVLMPDIVYTTGHPGDSAVDALTAAVKKVVDLGYADPERVGLQGHSWGGYQSSFVLTQTDIFSCVVTGAPLTNLVALFNELYKSSGNVNHGVTEFGQVRMGATPWEDLNLYISQSPLHNAANITTPFLILHGTEDGAVDWNQGLAYYSAARRLGKEVVLLSYPGEGHHLSRLENQKDFQVRMKAYFDHYLKGTPAPEWMTEGVDFLDKPQPKEGGRRGGR